MQDLASWSIKTAKAAGADDCRVDSESRRTLKKLPLKISILKSTSITDIRDKALRIYENLP